MEFYEAVSARHTVRDFLDEPVDDAVLRRILSAGMKAPTNDHLRSWHFIVVRDKETVLRLLREIPEEFSREEVDAVLRDWNLNDPCQRRAYQDAIPKQHRMLAQAACVIVPLFLCTTDLMHPASLSHLNGLASIWCCLENIFLASTAEGLGCALRIPLGDEAEWARSVLGFPAEYRMPCFVALGKPDDHAAPVAQKEYDLSQRLHFDRW
jgi:nitroreductase